MYSEKPSLGTKSFDDSFYGLFFVDLTPSSDPMVHLVNLYHSYYPVKSGGARLDPKTQRLELIGFIDRHLDCLRDDIYWGAWVDVLEPAASEYWKLCGQGSDWRKTCLLNSIKADEDFRKKRNDQAGQNQIDGGQVSQQTAEYLVRLAECFSENRVFALRDRSGEPLAIWMAQCSSTNQFGTVCHVTHFRARGNQSLHPLGEQLNEQIVDAMCAWLNRLNRDGIYFELGDYQTHFGAFCLGQNYYPIKNIGQFSKEHLRGMSIDISNNVNSIPDGFQFEGTLYFRGDYELHIGKSVQLGELNIQVLRGCQIGGGTRINQLAMQGDPDRLFRLRGYHASPIEVSGKESDSVESDPVYIETLNWCNFKYTPKPKQHLPVCYLPENCVINRLFIDAYQPIAIPSTTTVHRIIRPSSKEIDKMDQTPEKQKCVDHQVWVEIWNPDTGKYKYQSCSVRHYNSRYGKSPTAAPVSSSQAAPPHETDRKSGTRSAMHPEGALDIASRVGRR